MGTKMAVIGGALALQLATLGGLAWLVAHDEPGARPPIGTAPASPPGGVLSAGAPPLPMTGAGWRLVGQLSAHYALILRIEAENPRDARAIARQLVDPVKDAYVEVLVYFYPTGSASGLAVRRVQWTLASGYVEVNLRLAGPGRVPDGA